MFLLLLIISFRMGVSIDFQYMSILCIIDNLSLKIRNNCCWSITESHLQREDLNCLPNECKTSFLLCLFPPKQQQWAWKFCGRAEEGICGYEQDRYPEGRWRWGFPSAAGWRSSRHPQRCFFYFPLCFEHFVETMQLHLCSCVQLYIVPLDQKGLFPVDAFRTGAFSWHILILLRIASIMYWDATIVITAYEDENAGEMMRGAQEEEGKSQLVRGPNWWDVENHYENIHLLTF